MPGLYLSLPAAQDLDALVQLLHDYDLPLSAVTQEAPAFPADLPRPDFLRRASIAVLLGQPLPADTLRTILTGGDPLPANVLRRHLLLRLSLLPFLRAAGQAFPADGGFLLGNAMLIVPVGADDAVDIPLPPGVWTELNGHCHQGRLRGMRGYNETPILLRENTLLPVSMNGSSLAQTTPDDTDNLTLHWFQPAESASCTLVGCVFYRAVRNGDSVCVETNATKPFHLILHRDGVETLIR